MPLTAEDDIRLACPECKSVTYYDPTENGCSKCGYDNSMFIPNPKLTRWDQMKIAYIHFVDSISGRYGRRSLR